MEFPVLEHGNQPRLQLGISDGNAWEIKRETRLIQGFPVEKTCTKAILKLCSGILKNNETIIAYRARAAPTACH
jgi:hypothetical protein